MPQRPMSEDMQKKPRDGTTRRAAALIAGGLLVALAAGTLLATVAAIRPIFGPPATIKPADVAALLASPTNAIATPSIAASIDASRAASPAASPTAAPTRAPAPQPTLRQTPKPFSIDLYRRLDYVPEKTAVWCLSAAMQTSINIMSKGADRTTATQRRLFLLTRALAPAPDGSAEPEGWAMGLTRLGFGRYVVSVQPSIRAAIRVAATQLRKTNRPVGLMVWRGAHSWVMSGFTATADPALTKDFRVTAVRIEDVWYPRISRIWGRSRPPDALVPVGKLREDFLPWKRPQKHYPAKDGRFVIVIPTR
jgi:hypothetical protein